MATHTLTVASSATAGSFVGNPDMNTYYNSFGTYSFNGDSDAGVCMQVASDGKDVVWDSLVGAPPTFVFFTDDGAIPVDAVINSVQLIIRMKAVLASLQDPPDGGGDFVFLSAENFFHMNGTLSSSYSLMTSNALTLNPGNGLPWLRADLFSQGDSLNGLWGIDNVVVGAGDASMGFDYMGLVVDYTAGATFPVSGVVPATGPTIGGS